jgi:hypothetical protein
MTIAIPSPAALIARTRAEAQRKEQDTVAAETRHREAIERDTAACLDAIVKALASAHVFPVQAAIGRLHMDALVAAVDAVCAAGWTHVSISADSIFGGFGWTYSLTYHDPSDPHERVDGGKIQEMLTEKRRR